MGKSDVTFRLGYRQELDGLRGIAVCAVMLGHSGLLGKGADLRRPEIFPPLLTGGVFGVDIFFVLSGFLITTLLLAEHARTGKVDVAAFYTRRALRLLPPMGLLVGACVAYVSVFAPPESTFSFSEIGLATLYVSNFAIIVSAQDLGMLTPTWSLSVEEQFYTLWPLLLVAFCVKGPSQTSRFVCWTIILAILLRAALFIVGKLTQNQYLILSANFFLFARADSLMCGAAVAMIATWRGKPGWNGMFWRLSIPAESKIALWTGCLQFSALALLAMLLFAPSLGISAYVATYTCASIFTAILILCLLTLSRTVVHRILGLPVLVWIGKISYSLYLFHVPVFVLMAGHHSTLARFGAWPTYSAALALTFVLATLSYYLVELRFLRVKDRLSHAA